MCHSCAMPETPVALAIVAIVSAAVLGLAVRWWLAPARRHERALRRAIRRISHDTLAERVIPDGVDGEIQIDLVALIPKGLLVLEVRHAHGTVYGATSLDQWTALTPTSRIAFDNPLALLNRRVIALRALFGEDVPVLGRVVLVGDVQLGADLPETVVTPQGLLDEFGLGAQDRGGVAYAAQWEHLRGQAAA